jgi:DnaJ-class molecular chaperone
MRQQDYYEILGLSRQATPDEILEAFRVMIQRFHPDLHPNDSKEATDLLSEKTKAVNEAYNALRDPMKRREYDERTFGGRSTEEPTHRADEPSHRAEERPHEVNAETFRRALKVVFDEAKGNFVDVTSGELYRAIGGRTGRDYRMATCCSVMMSLKRPGDTVLAQPPKGKGATLTIRYVLPR